MKKTIRLLFTGHRLVGGIIALFFLMWFLTGLVLIYHPYPRLSEARLNEMKESLPDSLPAPREIEERAGGEIRHLSLRQFQGQTQVSVATDDTAFVYPSGTPPPILPVTYKFAEAEALRWIDAPIRRVDTLNEREQWILYSRYDRAMPIYKFYFDDPERHELFISGKTGEAQQLTNRNERIWAWLGAIPHKFYLPFIRKHLDRWETSITIGGTLCLLAALSGLALGLYLCVGTYRKQGRIANPYRKFAWRWHYALGLVFGLFLITWGMSGVFAMRRVPQWLVNSDGKYFFPETKLWGKRLLPSSSYALDYRLLKKEYPLLKEVEWTRFASLPAYRIIEGNVERWIDASAAGEIRPLSLPSSLILEAVKKIHGEGIPIRIDLLKEYDDYYLSYKHSYPLPVYRVTVDDAIRSRYYVDPHTGDIHYLNRNKMVRRWLFNAFHYLNVKFLIDRPALWTLCVWTLCLGGAAVCATGACLCVRRIGRIVRKQTRR